MPGGNPPIMGGGIPGGGMNPGPPGGGGGCASGGGGWPTGALAKLVCGRLRSVEDAALFCAAMRRSAAVPWCSPLVSFLYAYVTLMGRLHKN